MHVQSQRRPIIWVDNIFLLRYMGIFNYFNLRLTAHLTLAPRPLDLPFLLCKYKRDLRNSSGKHVHRPNIPPLIGR